MAFIMSLLERIQETQDVKVTLEKQDSLFERYISAFSREYRGL